MNRVWSGVVQGEPWRCHIQQDMPDRPGSTRCHYGPSRSHSHYTDHPDYPGLKNRPGPSRMTPTILKPPGCVPGPSQTVPDNPGPNKDLTPDRPNFSPGQCGTLVWLTFNYNITDQYNLSAPTHTQGIVMTRHKQLSHWVWSSYNRSRISGYIWVISNHRLHVISYCHGSVWDIICTIMWFMYLSMRDLQQDTWPIQSTFTTVGNAGKGGERSWVVGHRNGDAMEVGFHGGKLLSVIRF